MTDYKIDGKQTHPPTFLPKDTTDRDKPFKVRAAEQSPFAGYFQRKEAKETNERISLMDKPKAPDTVPNFMRGQDFMS